MNASKQPRVPLPPANWSGCRAMFRSGWGFHVDLDDLACGALIWQRAIRPLRLVRLRHQTRIKTGQDRINLASLPVEVFQIVEEYLSLGVQAAITYEPLFNFECGCDSYFDGLWEWEPILQAEDAFADQTGLKDQELVDAFLASDLFETLEDEYRDFHRDSDKCDIVEDIDEAWSQVVSDVSCDDEDFAYLEETGELRDALHDFTEDFGLIRISPLYEDDAPEYCLPREATTSLIFQHHSRETEQEPRKDQWLVQKAVDSKRLSRFIKLFRLKFLDGPSVFLPDVMIGDIYWIVADMNHKDYFEHVVERKSLEQVDEHNRSIEPSRKTLSERRYMLLTKKNLGCAADNL